jgi:hypothetical protein
MDAHMLKSLQRKVNRLTELYEVGSVVDDELDQMDCESGEDLSDTESADNAELYETDSQPTQSDLEFINDDTSDEEYVPSSEEAESTDEEANTEDEEEADFKKAVDKVVAKNRKFRSL